METYVGTCGQSIPMPVANGQYKYYNVQSCNVTPQTASIRFCLTAGNFNLCDYTVIPNVNITH
jgi:hypothetical protein